MKKVTPVITYTELLCRSIRSLELEIGKYNASINSLPAEHPLQADLDKMKQPLLEKLEACRMMYRIETGVDYN